MTADDGNGQSSIAIQQSFRKARRHSGHVRRLKVLLPLAAVLITIGLFGATFLQSVLPENISLDAASVENGMIVMTNPGMSGRNAKGIRYSLKAERALLPATDPDDSTVIMENVTAKVPVDETDTAIVKADRTIYDRATERLTINEPFTIELSSGMHATFSSAEIDLEAGTLSSDAPVSVTASQTSVVAQNVNIVDNGQRIIFGGGVHVQLSPSELGRTEK